MGGCSPALPSRPKSWGRKQAIPFGCNPCPYNARGGIIPGINILNSPSRPTQSKILRPVIAFLSWDYCVPEPKPQFWEKLGTAPPTLPAYPKLPGSQQKFLHLDFLPFFHPFSPIPLPRSGEESFLVACLLLIPSNLSRIKTPLRKNGPGPTPAMQMAANPPGPAGHWGPAGCPGPSSPAAGLHPQSPRAGGHPQSPPKSSGSISPPLYGA